MAPISRRVLGRPELAVGREAHVIELDLVEAAPDRLPSDGDVVGPDLLAEGIDPGQSLVVDPRLAGARVDDREVGPGVGQDVVLERHDAGDRVDATRLEVGHHRVELAQRGRPLGADGQRRLDLRRVDDPPAVALDVDDHGVQLGAGGEVEDAAADAAVAEAEVRQVGRLDRLRLQHGLDGAAGRRDPELLEPRRLHQEGGVERDLLDLEGAVGVGPHLGAAHDHRRAGQRHALVVEDAPGHRGRWPGDLGRGLGRLPGPALRWRNARLQPGPGRLGRRRQGPGDHRRRPGRSAGLGDRRQGRDAGRWLCPGRQDGADRPAHRRGPRCRRRQHGIPRHDGYGKKEHGVAAVEEIASRRGLRQGVEHSLFRQ